MIEGLPVFIERAKQAVAQLESFDEAKLLRDKAEAMRLYAKNIKASKAAQNECAEIKVRCERLMGTELAKTETQGPGKYQQGFNGETLAPTLADLGVDKNQSHRWQTIASVPEDEFEKQISDTKEKGREITSESVYRIGKQAKQRETRNETIIEASQGNTELGTEARYPIIYADPPWRYENPPIGASNRSIENHYPTMTLEEICNLPVAELATEDSVLFLWATAPKLAECMDVIKAWQFEYRTCLVWYKKKIGMGYHARNNHELLLISKRGSVPAPEVSTRPASVVEADRTAHSEKPDIFYEIIESQYPDLPKIELFARNAREGWERWGNQSGA